MSLMDAALEYAARGWRVFPCRPGTKTPATERGFYDASIDPVVIRAWWKNTPNANIAVWTGTVSGLYAIDVDDPSHPFINMLPATLCSRTPRGGSHFLYALSEPLPGTVGSNPDDAKNKFGYKVDSRGDGGYLLLAPSVVDGKPYTWIDAAAPLAPLPQFILDIMRPKKAERIPYIPSTVTGHGTSKWGTRTLELVCADMAAANEGGRNNTLNTCSFRVAQAVAGGHIDEWEARNALLDAAVSTGLPEKEAKRTIDSGFKGGLMAPRGPAAQPDPLGGAMIVCETETEVVDHMPEPEKPFSTVLAEQNRDAAMWDLLNDIHSLGGICETFPQWVMDGAEYRQPGLTLGALLALGAVLAGRRFLFDGMTSGLYVCAIADTAEGKGRPQSCLKRLLGQHWSSTLGPADFSSSAATVERVREVTGKGTGSLMVVDEYGAKLKTLLDPRVSGHQKDLRAILLELATIGTDNFYPAQSLSRGGETLCIRAPSLSVFGCSTPQALHDAVRAMSLKDGFLGRHVFVKALARLPMRNWEKPGDDSPPALLVEQVETIKVGHEAWHKSLPPIGNSKNGDPLFLYEPVVMPDDGAIAVFRAYAEALDARRRDHTDGDIPSQLLGRAGEYAKRVAMDMAMLSQPHCPGAPPVTAVLMQLAIRIVDASMETLASSIEKHAAENQHEADRKKVIAVIKENTAADGWISYRDILRKVRSIKANELEDMVKRLDAEGAVSMKQVKRTGSGGRTTVMLRLQEVV